MIKNAPWVTHRSTSGLYSVVTAVSIICVNVPRQEAVASIKRAFPGATESQIQLNLDNPSDPAVFAATFNSVVARNLGELEAGQDDLTDRATETATVLDSINSQLERLEESAERQSKLIQFQRLASALQEQYNNFFKHYRRNEQQRAKARTEIGAAIWSGLLKTPNGQRYLQLKRELDL